MTTSEFSNGFDILYNNITSNLAPGLDEYEKSVFLTKAQDLILKSYFDPELNKLQKGFDGSKRRQIDFSSLITTTSISDKIESAIFDTRDNSKSVTLNENILIILNEYVILDNGKRLTVQPLTYDLYDILMSKPFKRPTKNTAWRLLDSSNKLKADLIVGVGENIKSYTLRYLKRPKPIILLNLEEGLTIDGWLGDDPDNTSSPLTQCELDPILHQEILLRAVELAKAVYAGDLSAQIALGQNSQTNIGIIAPSRD